MSDTATTTESQSTWKIPPEGAPFWYEIPTLDVAALKVHSPSPPHQMLEVDFLCQAFYSSLFPSWEWKAATEGYPEERVAMFSFPAGSSALSGGIVRVTPDCKGEGVAELTNGHGTTLYHFVASIEETQKKIEELGGKVTSGKQREGENGWYVYCHDNQGNRFGIYELAKK